LIEAGEYVIENLETDGYLRKSASEIASEGGYTEKDIEKAAGLLHALEPAGIGTGNLRECFLAQIERYFPEDKLLHSIVYSHWESLIKKNYRKISDETGVPVSDISKSVSHIKKLAVAPLAGFFKKNRVFIIPEHYCPTVNQRVSTVRTKCCSLTNRRIAVKASHRAVLSEIG
jgi:RNA polymerase sigma-54 factor